MSPRSPALTLILLLLAIRLSPAQEVTAVRGSVRVDGHLDEAIWSNAAPSTAFQDFQTKALLSDTTFRVAFDDAWLYFGITCKHEHLNMLQPKVTDSDRNSMRDESLELFLAPAIREPAFYHHFALNFANARDTRLIAGSNSKTLAQQTWRSAVQRTANGWTAEVAVPLQLLKDSGHLNHLRINVARNRRIPVIDKQNVVIDELRQSSSWAPVGSSFHEQSSFKPIHGIPQDIKIRALPDIAIDQLKVHADGIRLTLRNRGKTPTQLRITLANHSVTLAPLSALQTADVDLPVPILQTSNTSPFIEIHDAQTDDQLLSRPISDTSAWRPLSVFTDRNYYTDESSIELHYTVRQPVGATLRVLNNDGTQLASLSPPGRTGSIRLPLHSSLQLELTRDSTPPTRIDVAVHRLPKHHSTEWKIDRLRRVLLENDQPFIPFGVVMSGVRADDDSAFKALAENHFNTFLVWNHTTPDGMAEYQRQAQKFGLRLISAPDECANSITWESHSRFSGTLLQAVQRVTNTNSLTQLKNLITLPISTAAKDAIYEEFYSKNIGTMMDAVKSVAAAPNIAGHFIMDEPLPIEALNQVRFGQDYYRRIKQIDPYHPVIVNYSSHIPPGDDYTNWSDILVTDPYWIPPENESTRSSPNHVAKTTHLTNLRALDRRQPVWQILACPRWSRCYKRPLSSEEIRAQTYLALIHRATGIFMFAYSNMREADWKTCQQLGKEISMLTPYLASSPLPTTIEYQAAIQPVSPDPVIYAPSPFLPMEDKFPHVHAVLLKDDRGRLVLLAANSRAYPVRCSFQIPNLTSATPLLGKDASGVRTNVLEETLAPHATRAWSIDAPIPDRITSHQIVRQSDLNQREPFLPNACRKDHRNLFPNPSFEDATAAGVADYCLLSSGAGIDQTHPHSGKQSIRLVRSENSKFENLLLRCDPPLPESRNVTFSVHLRSATNGTRAWIRSANLNSDKPNGEGITVALTEEWQRFSITGVIPAKTTEALYEIRLLDVGTLWVDDAQLEFGSSVTPFEGNN